MVKKKMFRNHEIRCNKLRTEKQNLINEIRILYSSTGLWVFFNKQDIIKSRNTFKTVFYANGLSHISLKKLNLLLEKAREIYEQ